MILLLAFYKYIIYIFIHSFSDSLMLGKLLRGTGMRRISISFLLQDGRWAIFSLALRISLVMWLSSLCGTCTNFYPHCSDIYCSFFTYLLQIYDPTKKWERYTIHGDWFNDIQQEKYDLCSESSVFSCWCLRIHVKMLEILKEYEFNWQVKLCNFPLSIRFLPRLEWFVHCVI